MSIDLFEVSACLSCPAPNNLNAASITTNSAILSWTDNAGVSSFDIQLDTTGFTPTGTPTDAGVTNNYTYGGLASATTYDYYVRAICGPGDESDWVGPYTFTTECATISSFPWTETFEDTSSTRVCWSQEYVNGTHDWVYQLGGNGSGVNTANSGVLNAALTHTTTGTSTKFITPALDISGLTNPELKFYHTQEDWVGDQDTLRVYYKTSAAGAWTMIPGAEWTNSISTWTEESFTLPSPSNDYYIAFEGVDGYGYGVTLDDVTVQEQLITDVELLEPTSGFGCSSFLTNATNIPVEFENVGNTTIAAGESLTFTLDTAGSNALTETITLTTDLNPGDTWTGFTTNTVDLSAIGTYFYDAAISYPADVNTSNDTISAYIVHFSQSLDFVGQVNDTISILTTDIPYTIVSDYTLTPDSTLINDYLWGDGTTTTQNYVANSAGWYSLEVTTESCTIEDSVYIEVSTPLVTDVELLEPTSGYSCDFTDTTHAPYEIENVGTATIAAGESLTFTIDTSGTLALTETITLTADFNPGDILSGFTTSTVDLSAIGTYFYDAAISYPADANTSNDTISGYIVHFSQSLDFVGQVNDTISILTTDLPYTIVSDYTLTPDSTLINDYLWGDGTTTTQNYVANSAGWYSLEVLTESCTIEDSVYIEVSTPLVTDIELLEPTSVLSCDFTDTTHAPYEIENVGTATIAAGESLTFTIDTSGTLALTETITLTTDLNPGDTWAGFTTNTVDLSAIGTYFYDAAISYPADANTSNDTISGYIVHYSQQLDFIGAVNDTIHILLSDFPYTIQTDLTLTPDSTLSIDYLWGDGITTTPDIVVDTSGWYSVMVTTDGYCTTEDSVYVDATTDIKDITIDELSVYPNPNNGQFVIDFTLSQKQDVRLTIISSTGQIVREFKFDDIDKLNKSVNLNDVSDGMYNLRISTGDKQFYRQIIVR